MSSRIYSRLPCGQILSSLKLGVNLWKNDCGLYDLRIMPCCLQHSEQRFMVDFRTKLTGDKGEQAE